MKIGINPVRKTQIIAKALFGFAIIFILPTLTQAQSSDKRGSSDHPLIERFPDTRIRSYRKTDYARLSLPTGPVPKAESREEKRAAMPPTTAVEGELTQILYKANSKETSPLRVYRSYEAAFKKSGFTPLFVCESDKECGEKFVVKTYLHSDAARRNAFQSLNAGNLRRDEDYFFWSGYAKSANQDYALTLLVAKRAATNSPTDVALEIVAIESLEIEDLAVDLSVEKIDSSIKNTGRVILDGIFFDFNKATLTAKSRNSIGVIAEYLRNNPNENYYVVGHTDNVGELAYNMEFSAQRAAAVIAELVENEKIAKTRLREAGSGPLNPVASNGTDEGRALNRRVELVLDN